MHGMDAFTRSVSEPAQGTPLRVALVCAAFPTRSETFIVQQVMALVAHGAHLTVFCNEVGRAAGDLLEGFPVSPPAIRRWPVTKYEILRSVLRGILAPNGLSTRRAFESLREGTETGIGRLKALGMAAALTAEGPFDAVLAHFGPVGEQLTMIRDRYRLRFAVATIFHGYDVSRHLRLLGDHPYPVLRRSGDLLLPVSDFWARRLVELGFSKDRVVVQHMGVDLAAFGCIERGESDGRLQVLSVGRLVDKKGFEFGVRAVASLLAEGCDLEYRIAGDGPLRDTLEEIAGSFGFGERIRFLGWQAPRIVARLMRQADILLVPSVTAGDGDMEGIPVVLMEAMAAGTLVVATRHSGIPEIVMDRQTGWLAPERDVPALAAALRDAIDARGRWPQIRVAARAEIERSFNWQKLAGELSQLLAAVVEQRRGDSAAGR